MIEPQFELLLRGVQVRFSRFFAYLLENQQTTVSQYNVLAALDTEDFTRMHQVARALHISKPAITHLVDRLEKEELISRNVDPQDRRAYVITLTKKGKQVVRNVQKQFISFVTEVLDSTSAQDRETMKNFYKRLTEHFDKKLAACTQTES